MNSARPSPDTSRRGRLGTYLAAGTGALTAAAAASPAQAVIMHTSGLIPVATDSSVLLDFDGDSSAEFRISQSTFTPMPPDPVENKVNIQSAGSDDLSQAVTTTAIAPGASISSALSFNTVYNPPSSPPFNKVLIAFLEDSGTPTGLLQPDTRGFVGVKFDLPSDSVGEVYGWVDIEIDATVSSATIHGYAYETCGTAIIAGATSGGATCSSSTTVSEPSSLLLIAAGFSGLAFLRRRRRSAAAA